MPIFQDRLAMFHAMISTPTESWQFFNEWFFAFSEMGRRVLVKIWKLIPDNQLLRGCIFNQRQNKAL